jgi:hypothetical protein
MKSFSLLIILLSSYISSQAQVIFSSEHFGVDEWLKIVVCNDIPSSIPSGTTTLIMDKTYTLSSPISSIAKGSKFTAYNSGRTYEIFFTELPLVKIDGSGSLEGITTAHESNADIKITEPSGNIFSSPIGIKVRGASSAAFPKKSFRVQLKNSIADKDYKDTTLFNLREDKRWLMLAMHNEKLRLNNKISHDLWVDMHKLYYAEEEPEAHSGIRNLYVEAFIHGSYRGVYLFTEDLDRKQLKLKKTKDDGTVRGELYKADGFGNTEFNVLPPLPSTDSEIWGGWELKHPDAEENDWLNLYNFTQFVKESNNTNFRNQIGSKLHLDNLMDFIIFLNLTMAGDNRGKNTFLAKYNKDEPYFYGVWDLDGTWGYYAYGERSNSHEVFLSFHLLDRVISTNPDNFKHKLATRWFNLRNNILRTDSLHHSAEKQYNYLLSNKVYERENKRWDSEYSTLEINYLKNWTTLRLNWLDNYFQQWVESCAAPTISFNPEKITNGESTILTATGCAGIVKWHEDNTTSLFLSEGSKFTTPDLYQDTNYYASCTIGSCLSSVRSSINIEPKCSENNLSYNESPQTPSDYESDGSIMSKASITGKTMYNSAKSILLEPGFKTETGKVFYAKIEGCD